MTKHLTALLVALSILLSACGTLTDEGLLFKTADPHLSIGFRLQKPPVTIEPDVVPLPTVTPTAEPCEPIIKGNINAQGEKIAHSPSQANYNNVIIDESKGEKYFCTLEQAEVEGWRAAQR